MTAVVLTVRNPGYGWNMTGTPVDRAMRMLSRSANKSRLWLALAAAGAFVPGATRRAAVRGVGALAATSLITNAVLKPLTRRNRPLADLTPVVRRLRRPPRTTSFPSGHAASAAAFAAGVGLEAPALGAAVAPLAAAVGYSRIHVGVHHVSDVVAGAALGTAVALGTRRWWPVRPAGPTPVRRQVAAPAITAGEGLVIVINQGAGGDDPVSQIRDRLPAAELVVLEPGRGADVDAALASRARVARAFGVVGGDGSVAAAAAAALRHNVPLAVFPGGTFNHFARDAGIQSFDDTVRALEAGSAVAVDVAAVNGVPFLNTAVIGAYPDMVRRRAELEPKLGQWLAMVVATGQVLRQHQPLRLRVDGETLSAWALFVGNGVYHGSGPAPAWRPRLDDGWLDVQYAVAGVALSRTRAVLSTLLGITGHNGVRRTRVATELRVVSASGPVRLARDGELGDPDRSFHFIKLPGTLVVYRPE